MAKLQRSTRLAAACAATLFSALPMAAQACNSEPYIGTICTFAMSWCPQGYVTADGRTLPLNQYQALFAVLGFQYGGDNVNNFAIPDLRGRFPIGTGTGPGLVAITLAQKVGQQQLALTQAQTPVAPHTHAAAFTPTTANTPVTIPATTGNLTVTAALPVSTSVGTSNGTMSALNSGQNGYLAGLSGTTGVDPISFSGPYTASAPSVNPAHLPATVTVSGNPSTAAATVQVPTVTGGAVVVASASAPASQPISTQSPALGQSVCIAVTGLYPSRP